MSAVLINGDKCQVAHHPRAAGFDVWIYWFQSTPPCQHCPVCLSFDLWDPSSFIWCRGCCTTNPDSFFHPSVFITVMSVGVGQRCRKFFSECLFFRRQLIKKNISIYYISPQSSLLICPFVIFNRCRDRQHGTGRLFNDTNAKRGRMHHDTLFDIWGHLL